MFRGHTYLAAFLWIVIAFLVIYPLSILVAESFKISGTDAWGLGNYLEFFKDSYYLKCFGNTLGPKHIQCCRETFLKHRIIPKRTKYIALPQELDRISLGRQRTGTQGVAGLIDQFDLMAFFIHARTIARPKRDFEGKSVNG